MSEFFITMSLTCLTFFCVVICYLALLFLYYYFCPFTHFLVFEFAHTLSKFCATDRQFVGETGSIVHWFKEYIQYNIHMYNKFIYGSWAWTASTEKPVFAPSTGIVINAQLTWMLCFWPLTKMVQHRNSTKKVVITTALRYINHFENIVC